jgi:hypothetical protein
MDKMMGLLMTKNEIGYVGTSRFVQAIGSIVDAIEQEVKIPNFLKNRSKKNYDKGKTNEAVESMKSSRNRRKYVKISLITLVSKSLLR